MSEIFLLSAKLPVIEPVGANLPTDIQYLPPGTHTVTAMVNEKVGQRTVTITPQTAAKIAESLHRFQARAESGEDDVPFLDFNHDDSEASARVKDIYWGGDDQKAGGVRAKVEWTGPGQAALAGKAYRRFSPQLLLNAAGEIVGAPLNMGGLVNKAAFKTIAPLIAKDAGEPSTDMTPQETAALEAANAGLKKQVETLTAKVASLESDQTIKAKDAEIATLKAKNQEQANQIKAGREKRAKDLVQAKVKDGSIAPQDEKLQAKLVELIAADDANEVLLASYKPNPALGTIVPGSNPGSSAGGGTEPEQFVALVKAKHVELKNKEQALQAAIIEKPKLYEAWRGANGQPGIVLS